MPDQSLPRSSARRPARELPLDPPPWWDHDLWFQFRSAAIYEEEVPRDSDGEPLLDMDGVPTRRSYA